MALDAKLLLEQMRGQRKRWVQVAEGKRVQILLPTELEVVRHFVKPGADGKVNLSCDIEEVKRFTCGWEGFTEADLLGAAVGAADAVPFDPGLWGLVIEEHLDWVRAVAKALLDGVVERQLAREADAKN
jgi:hypothetical protein